MSAVWITLSRFPLLLLSVLALYFGSPAVQLGGTALLFAGLLLDTVDGSGAWGFARASQPFDQQAGALGRFLVASPAIRIGYSVSKVAIFCGLPLMRALGAFTAGAATHRILPALEHLVPVALYATVALCLLRGLPVILGVPRQCSPAGLTPSTKP